MSHDGLSPSRALTSAGQVLVANSSGVASVLAAGGANTILRVDDSGVLNWGTLHTDLLYLATDVSMPSANTFYDALTLTFSVGTRLVVAAVTVQLDGGADHITARLWPGSGISLSASAEGTGASGDVLTLVLVAVAGASTIHLAVAGTVGGHTIKATCPHNDTGHTATYLHSTVFG